MCFANFFEFFFLLVCKPVDVLGDNVANKAVADKSSKSHVGEGGHGLVKAHALGRRQSPRLARPHTLEERGGRREKQSGAEKEREKEKERLTVDSGEQGWKS